jgi:hypothetical protein
MDHAFFALAFLALTAPAPFLVAASPCVLPTVSVPLGPCNITLPGLPTVYSWGARLNVNGTFLCASPSTVASSCLLEDEEICLPDNPALGNLTKMNAAECRSRRGNFLTNNGLEREAPVGLEALNQNWDALQMNLTTFDFAVHAPFKLQGTTTVAPVSGVITQGTKHKNSHLSLDAGSTLMSELLRNEQIKSKAFGLDVGSTSYHNPRPGRLTLGGYEPDKLVGNFYEYNMTSYKPMLGSRLCPLQITISQMVLNINNRSLPLIQQDGILATCVEPYASFFPFLPPQTSTPFPP